MKSKEMKCQKCKNQISNNEEYLEESHWISNNRRWIDYYHTKCYFKTK